MGLLPAGRPLSTAGSASPAAHLALGESRISVAGFSLPSFTALSTSLSLALPGTRARARVRVIWTRLITREPSLEARETTGWAVASRSTPAPGGGAAAGPAPHPGP